MSRIDHDGHVRARHLHLGHVHRVAPDQQLFVAGRDEKRRMPGRVAVRRNGGHARKDLAGAEQAHAVAIGRHLLACLLEEHLFLPLGAARHGGIVVPMARLVLVHHQLGIGEVAPAGGKVGEPRRMVRMHVREQDRLDLGGRNAGRREVHGQMPGGLAEIVARAGLHQRQPSRRAEQERVHRDDDRRPKGLGKDPLDVGSRYVAQHLRPAGKRAIAQRRHRDVAYAPVVDAGDLFGGGGGHGGTIRERRIKTPGATARRGRSAPTRSRRRFPGCDRNGRRPRCAGRSAG
jgi:hypothetical protein